MDMGQTVTATYQPVLVILVQLVGFFSSSISFVMDLAG